MASTSLPLPELKFLAPQITLKHRVSLLKFRSCSSTSRNSRYNVALRTRIRAVKEEGAVIEERVSDVKWSGNGAAASAARVGSNGSVNGSSFVVNESGNGSLVKYVNGNGVAAAKVVEVEDFGEAGKRREEDGRKKRLEEIGKEEAWFKQNEKSQVEV